MLNTTATLALFVATTVLAAGAAFAQAEGCPEIPGQEPTAADVAYQQAKYETADSLYQQALQQKPNDAALTASLVHTLLREGRVADAAARASAFLADSPRSALALTALAEVQLRKGQPWMAMETLDSAAAADRCYARVHLIRSRIFRIDSMYASERSELATAYQIDPKDSDIHRVWAHTVNPANDIVRIEESLATMTDLDPLVREKAQASASNMRTLLSEDSRTCQSTPGTVPVTLPLLPAYENVKEISGYKLEVQLPKSKAKLIVDTAASGIYISRQLADANGLQHADGAPANTVQAESLHVGAMAFLNCMVGVSEERFPDGVEGYIGSDVFADYLVTLNFPLSRLELAPLPASAQGAKNTLPGDRYAGPEVQGYAPVYHKSQYLLVPVMLDKKDRRLFALDTGIRLSTMTSEVAHSISNTRLNFTNSMRTVSGATLQIYRDSFDFQFANLSLDHRDHILEFDPSAVEQNAGMQVAGLLGFDILHSLVMRIDYRDGLVQFDSPAPGVVQKAAGGAMIASAPASGGQSAPNCASYAGQNAERPLSTAIRGSVIGWLDSGHLSPGQAIRVKVAQDWIAHSCSLAKGASLYGHVVTAKAAKGASELAVIFDQGDCSSHPRQALSLRVVALRDATSFVGVHNAIPTEVAGGARDISSTAASMGSASDDDMKAGSATYHPGVVDGIPHLKLTPEGGPQCSAMMTSEERSVHLGTGTEFILTMQAEPE